MMEKRVYIETTIPSFFHTRRSDPESIARKNWTREWWDRYSPCWTLATSVAVHAEINRGRSEIKRERLKLLSGLLLLEISSDIEDLTDIYIERKVAPRDPVGDALHLAIAVFHRIDILLTWNCRHLANPNKLEHLRMVNFHLNLPTPLITTPLNFLGGNGGED